MNKPLTPHEQALLDKHIRIGIMRDNPKRVAYIEQAGGKDRFPEFYHTAEESAELQRILAKPLPATKFHDSEWWDTIQFFIFIGVLILIGLIWKVLSPNL